ncbi:MAG: hypothetical protein ACFNYI_07365, partial [Eubacterium sp.]
TSVSKRALLKQNTITSASSSAKGTLKLNVKKMKYTGYYVKLTGNGSTKYYRFTDYKTTALTIRNLKSGSYKVTVYNYTKSGSTTFNGCASKSVSVKVK